MTNDDIITELLAIRARCDAAIERLRAASAKPANTNANPITYMKLNEFATRWQTSRSTLHKRIGEGLPVCGEAHDRRIKVVDGDAWMEKRTKRKVA